MEEVLEVLVNILCPTSESYSSCVSFLHSHASQGIFVQLIYFLFFPTLFIILFVYILSKSVLKGGLGTKASGLRILIGIAVYIYIIINGWYAAALPLAEFWIVIIIVLFGVWYFISNHFENRLREGSFPMTGTFPSLSGIKEKYQKFKGVKDEIEGAISFVNAAQKLADNVKSGKSQRPADDIAEIRSICATVSEIIKKYELTPEGQIYGAQLRKLKNQTEKLLKFLENMGS